MQKLPTVIDESTGEVITSEEQDIVEGSAQFLALLEEMGVANARFLLQDTVLATQVAVEDQADVMDLYEVEPLNFSDVTNRTLRVVGAAIYEFPAGIKADQTTFPRYFQSRILVDLDGELRIVKSSGQSLLRHIAFMCRQNGWFLFAEPIEYKFMWRGAGKPHLLDRVHKTVKHITPKSHRKEKDNA